MPIEPKKNLRGQVLMVEKKQAGQNILPSLTGVLAGLYKLYIASATKSIQRCVPALLVPLPEEN